MILTILMLSLLLMVSGISAYGAENAIVLQIDGKNIPTDVAPVIKDNRTLVPARAVFEAMGGIVSWDAKNPADISIQYKETLVELKVGSTIASVGGIQKTLDVPAQLVNDRTLIPVRFVSESLLFKVQWNQDTKTVSISSPQEGQAPVEALLGEITSFTVAETGNKHRVTIAANNPIADYTNDSLTNPTRFFVDIPKFGLSQTTSQVSITDPNCAVTTIRGAMNENNTTRIVMDLKEQSIPTISLSEDKKTMYLDFNRLKFEPLKDGKLVVMLDPGHGKSTGGKRSPDESLMEYEFNRDMANRIKPLLEAAGIEVLLTVTDDTDTPLKDRCAIANESQADVFVSVHANAFGRGDWDPVSGWEIYVYKKGGVAQELAKAIQAATIPKLGLKDRGLKEAEFYVVKNTNIPAVLIEHGFYTNLQEVEKLKSPAFRQQLAEADAAGIVQFFQAYK